MYDTRTGQLPYVPDAAFAQEMAHIILRINNITASDLPSIEKKVRELMVKYPQQPSLYNYLSLCAQFKGDMISFRTINEQTVQKFPDYVMAKISLIHAMLMQNRLEEVPVLLNNAWSLDEVIKTRKVFHITEFEDYYASLMLYFLRAGELRKAQLCFDLLDEEGEYAPDEYFAVPTSNLVERSISELVEIKYQKVLDYLDDLGIVQSFIKPIPNKR